MAPSAALLIHCAALLLTLAAGCADAHDVGPVSQDDPSASGSGERTSSTAAESDDAAVYAGLAQPALAIQETFQFPEGPVWDEKSSTLFFTDISGDAIYRLQLPDALELVLRPAGQPDGLALAPDGSLYVAGFGARNVWRLHEGERQLIAERYEGKRFNSPDDVIVRMTAIGVCGSDLHVIKGEWPRPTPIVLGHEGAGVIERIGSEVVSTSRLAATSRVPGSFLSSVSTSRAIERSTLRSSP